MEITEELIYNACEAMPIAKVKKLMPYLRTTISELELNTPARLLYFLSQVLYLSGEFIMQQDFEYLFKISSCWKKYNLNNLADTGDLYGIIRLLSPNEHDLKSVDYLDRLHRQLADKYPLNANP